MWHIMSQRWIFKKSVSETCGKRDDKGSELTDYGSLLALAFVSLTGRHSAGKRPRPASSMSWLLCLNTCSVVISRARLRLAGQGGICLHLSLSACITHFQTCDWQTLSHMTWVTSMRVCLCASVSKQAHWGLSSHASGHISCFLNPPFF